MKKRIRVDGYGTDGQAIILMLPEVAPHTTNQQAILHLRETAEMKGGKVNLCGREVVDPIFSEVEVND